MRNQYCFRSHLRKQNCSHARPPLSLTQMAKKTEHLPACFPDVRRLCLGPHPQHHVVTSASLAGLGKIHYPNTANEHREQKHAVEVSPAPKKTYQAEPATSPSILEKASMCRLREGEQVEGCLNHPSDCNCIFITPVAVLPKTTCHQHAHFSKSHAACVALRPM